MINTESANIIYNEVESELKEIKWYEESDMSSHWIKKKINCMKIFFSF